MTSSIYSNKSIKKVGRPSRGIIHGLKSTRCAAKYQKIKIRAGKANSAINTVELIVNPSLFKVAIPGRKIVFHTPQKHSSTRPAIHHS